MNDLAAAAAAEQHEIVRLRRHFHRFPELSFVEHETSQTVREYLQGLGLEVHATDTTGLWADLEVPGARKRIALRADMDALAMDEVAAPTKRDFVSERRGAAHCCGHDTHMAMLLGAAKLLTQGGVAPVHNVRFLFQHAEERSPGGAIDLIEAGCLEGVDEVYGLHVIPPLPSGKFSMKAGPFMAAADQIHVRIKGKGGHAAYPQLLHDPIVAACHAVVALQTLVSRRTSPLEALVVSIATMQGGSGTSNVIPDVVELRGTVRTLVGHLREAAPTWIAEVLENCVRAFGCSAELDYRRGYPVLVNDGGATATAREAVLDLFGEEGLVEESEAWMGGEDFARYAELRPSCFAFLGVGAPDKGIVAPNHATDFDVDEEALWRGTAWFARLAQRP